MRKVQFFINTIAALAASFLFYSVREFPFELSLSLVMLFSIVLFSPLFTFRKEPILALVKVMPLIYFIFYPMFFILTWTGLYDEIPFYEIDSYNVAIYYIFIGFYFFYLPLLLVKRKKTERVSFFDRIKPLTRENIIFFTRFFVIATFMTKGAQFILGFYFFLTINESTYYTMMFNFGFFNLFINSFSYLSIFLFYVGWKKYNIEHYRKYLFYFILILTVFNIPSGSKQVIFSAVIFVFSCFNLIDNKNIYKYLIFLFAVYISTKSLISDYRTAVVSGDADIGFTGIAEIYKSADYSSESTRNALERLSLVNVLKAVFDFTPKYIPYEGLEKLLNNSLIVFIPRFLWPDKPVISKGNLMGKQYGLIVYENDMTSIGISQIGDIYRYGGLWFISFGMTIIGLLYAFLERNFNYGYGFGRFFYLFMFVNNLIWVERDLDAIFGIFIYTVTLTAFLLLLNIFTGNKLKKNSMVETI